MPVRNGTGAALVLGTTAYDVEVTGFSQGDMSTPSIDVTHLGSTTAREFIPGDLIDFGELSLDIHLDPDKLGTFKTVCGLSQPCTLTFPVVTGETSGATMSGTGFITSHGFSVPLEDKIVGSATLKWGGDVTFTAAT